MNITLKIKFGAIRLGKPLKAVLDGGVLKGKPGQLLVYCEMFDFMVLDDADCIDAEIDVDGDLFRVELLKFIAEYTIA